MHLYDITEYPNHALYRNQFMRMFHKLLIWLSVSVKSMSQDELCSAASQSLRMGSLCKDSVYILPVFVCRRQREVKGRGEWETEGERETDNMNVNEYPTFTSSWAGSACSPLISLPVIPPHHVSSYSLSFLFTHSLIHSLTVFSHPSLP